MVDYNRDATITTPPGDLLKVAILERRAYFINALEEYNKSEYRGGSASDHVVRAALKALLMEVRSAFKRDKLSKGKRSEEDGDLLAWQNWSERLGRAETASEAEELFYDIDEWLYHKNLTKFDTRKDIPSELVEERNEHRERI